MTISQSEAEKLARSVRPSEIASWVTLSGDNLRALCDHILSGDMRREIENAAFERVIQQCGDVHQAGRVIA